MSGNDAQTVPVVTGSMDDTVIDKMIDLARTAAEVSWWHWHTAGSGWCTYPHQHTELPLQAPATGPAIRSPDRSNRDPTCPGRPGVGT